MALNDIKVPKENAQGTFDEVVLTASDISAVPTSRTISSGTGLTGGGDLTANRTLAVTYGTTAGTACQGNDSRLSDSRNSLPHKASHATGGTDALAPSDIGAMYAIEVRNTTIITSDTILAAGRNIQQQIESYSSSNLNVTLPISGNQNGDTFTIIARAISTGNIAIRRQLHDGTGGGPQFTTIVTAIADPEKYVFRYGIAWTLVQVDTHTHTPSEVGLGNVSNTAQVTSVTGTAPIVSSGGTAPAISISAATTSAAGAMSSADKTKLDAITGTNTGDQTITLTGDVTGSGTGSFAATIANNAVTNAKLAQVATSTLKGRATASTGNVEDLTASQARTLLNVADGATANSSDAQLRDRSTHTGTQAHTTITGLGDAATKNTGTTAGTLAAGDDSRIIGAIQSTLVDAKGDLIVATAADTVARLPVGATNGHVLTVESSEAAGMKWSAASGGVGGSTGSVSTAALRASGTGGATLAGSDINIEDATTSTANNVTISNQHSGQTNSALVLSPKGTGSLSASKPNGAASGGNGRGANATDWQTLRTAATQVASGTGSIIVGGDRNTSSNTCTIAGGETCTASGTYSIALGRTNSATTGAANAVVGGQDNTASGRESFIAAGNRNTASAGCCAILSGDDATLDRPYMTGHSGGRFAASGDSQSININLRAKTTTNSPVELKVGGYAVTSQTISIPAGKVISGIVNIQGVKSDGSLVAHYIRQFSYKRVGATSTLVGTATIGTDIINGTSITFNDPDTNGDAISISVTGVASETWRWTAHISAVETAYGT